MKNILIPSDFSVQSLDCIKHLVHKFRCERLNILLVHVFLMSDSISDLMLLSRRSKEYDYVSDEFRNICTQLEQEYREQINYIQVKCFYGSTVAVFKNFLEGHQIDLIVYPEQYQFRKLCKTSLDPSQLITKCGREVLILSEESPSPEVKDFVWVRQMSYSLSMN